MARSDRPISRQLVKVGSRLLLGRSRAHVQDWFPGLRLQKPLGANSGAVFFRNREVASLLRADAVCSGSGSAIYIVGSGPSVRDADLTQLPERSTLLLNGAISLIPDVIHHPLAVAVEDERFIFRHFDLLRQAVPKTVPCLLSVSAIRAICEHDPDFLSERAVVLIDNILRPYNKARRSLDDVRSLAAVVVDQQTGAGFSLDPDAGVFQAGSVAVSALQFAVHCRPKTIGFFGIDISNAATEPRFYEKMGSAAFSGVARAETTILDHIGLAQSIAADRGTVLVNHSAVSALSKIGLAYVAPYASTGP